jgi:hypothetical protein
MHIYGWIWIHMMLWMQNSSIDFPQMYRMVKLTDSSLDHSSWRDEWQCNPYGVFGTWTAGPIWICTSGNTGMNVLPWGSTCTSVDTWSRSPDWPWGVHRNGHCNHQTSRPLDLQVWGYTNDLVYERKVDIQEDFICHVVDVAWHISDWGTLHCVTCSVVNWARMCI